MGSGQAHSLSALPQGRLGPQVLSLSSLKLTWASWASRAWPASSRASMDWIFSVSCEFSSLASLSFPWRLLSSSHLLFTSASEDCNLLCSSEKGSKGRVCWGQETLGWSSPQLLPYIRALRAPPLLPLLCAWGFKDILLTTGAFITVGGKLLSGFVLQDPLG